ncbi:hypothetical protein [Roseofilum casamattae]|nr:hypothetical protein [Roseofilum casamattae]
MSKRFPGKPNTQTNGSHAIDSPLQAALSNLNISLEEELTRYRRHRQGASVSPGKTYSLSRKGKPLDLLQPTSAIAKASPVAATETAEDIGLPTTGESELNAIALSHSLPDAELAEDSLGFESSNPPDDYLESSEELLRSLAEEEEDDDPPIVSDRRSTNPWLSPLGIGSILLLLLLCTGLGVVLLNPSLIQHLLPKQWFNSPPASPPETPSNNSNALLLRRTPQPRSSEFAELTLDRLSVLQPDVAREASPVVSTTTVEPEPELPGRNIVADEPSESSSTSGLNLRSLSLPVAAPEAEPETSPATPQTAIASEPFSPPPPQPAIAPQPFIPPPPPQQAIAPQPFNPPPPPPNSEELPQLQPAAVIPTRPGDGERSTVAAAPTGLQGFAGSIPIAVDEPVEEEWMPEPVVTLAEDADLEYYVVADYEGGESMAQIQALVPDAYLRNFAEGIYIQLGRFADKSMAAALADELNMQGVPARIYQQTSEEDIE